MDRELNLKEKKILLSYLIYRMNLSRLKKNQCENTHQLLCLRNENVRRPRVFILHFKLIFNIIIKYRM